MEKLCLLICLCVFVFIASYAQKPRDVIEVNVTISKKIRDSIEMSLEVEVRNMLKRPVEVPKDDVLGYSFFRNGFVNIQVQKDEKGVYSDLPINARIDNFSPVDTDTLEYNEAKKWQFNIFRCYKFLKGKYRVRVVVAFSALNDIKDQVSEWSYFSCEQDIKPWN